METGNAVEELLIPTLYRRRFDVELIPGPKIGEGPPVVGRQPWMHARHDFVRSDDRTIVEAKKISRWDDWGPDGSDQAPLEYLVQVVWQQLVVRADDAEIVAWNKWDETMRVYDIPWRQNTAAGIERTISDWYERHVVEGVPPPLQPTAACSSALNLLNPMGARSWRNPDGNDLALARDIHRIKAELEDLETKKFQCEVRLKDRIGKDYGIRGVASWSSKKDGTRGAFRLLYEPGVMD